MLVDGPDAGPAAGDVCGGGGKPQAQKHAGIGFSWDAAMQPTDATCCSPVKAASRSMSRSNTLQTSQGSSNKQGGSRDPCSPADQSCVAASASASSGPLLSSSAVQQQTRDGPDVASRLDLVLGVDVHVGG